MQKDQKGKLLCQREILCIDPSLHLPKAIAEMGNIGILGFEKGIDSVDAVETWTMERLTRYDIFTELSKWQY